MRQVKLILTESVAGLGDAGAMVAVKVGYARNYLLPQGKALLATESKVREFEHKHRMISDKAARELKDMQALRDRLQSLQLEVTARVGEEGKLFGSVTTANIAELLAEKSFKIDRRKILLDESLKEAGQHLVRIRLAPDLIAEVPLSITAEEA
ncbi:MAG: 50S ribosomal protein L9 [Myxococcota bacterium]|jgi:large subunit ribosomal protein L9